MLERETKIAEMVLNGSTNWKRIFFVYFARYLYINVFVLFENGIWIEYGMSFEQKKKKISVYD